MSKWIPVTEKLPPNNDEVFILHDSQHPNIGFYELPENCQDISGGYGWYYNQGLNNINFEVTHWMEIPKL